MRDDAYLFVFMIMSNFNLIKIIEIIQLQFLGEFFNSFFFKSLLKFQMSTLR